MAKYMMIDGEMRPVLADGTVDQAQVARDLAAAGERRAKMEAMLADQQPPCCTTDNDFLKGHCNGSQFAGQFPITDKYQKQADLAGVNTKGKVYMPSLASWPGDPKAWVSDSHDVRRVLDEKNMGCDGAIKRTAVEKEPDAPPPDATEELKATISAAVNSVGERLES